MPVNIAIFYAQEDAILLDKLKPHLRPLQKQNLINFLSDQNIGAGASWKQEIEGLTNITHIYLFLVSQYSLNLDYFYSTEVLHIVESIVDPLVKSKKVPLERYNLLLSNTHLGREEIHE